jgi:hypothetical protein
MHRNTLFHAIGVAALTFGLAACSADSSTGPDASLAVPDSEINLSIAADAGDAVATSVDLMSADEASEGASSSAIATLPGAGASVDAATSEATVTCDGPDADGWFTCDRTTFRGLDVTRQRRFWEDGNYGLGWDAATDSVNHRRTVTGSYSPAWKPAKTIWVNRADTATLAVDRTGSPTLHVWTGTGVRTDSSAYANAHVTRAFHYTAYDTATAVAFAMPRTDHPWPVSGTIVHNVTTLFVASRDGRSTSKTVIRRVVVTFNGTSSVPIQVGELTCTLDLDTHEISNCT